MIQRILFLFVFIIYTLYGFKIYYSQATLELNFDLENTYPNNYLADKKTLKAPELSPLYQETFASFGETKLVHSATLTTIDDQKLRAFWYGGSREGAKDVAIYTNVFDQANQSWSTPKAIIDRNTVRNDTHRYIRKLGNPVVFRDKTNRLWLFFVSVSLGGWAGSAINVTYSDDFGNTFAPIRRLISSPFVNISTLIKTPPIALTGHHLALPAYHEFIGKFAEVLYLDQHANVIDKRRITHGRYTLQPSIVATSSTQATAYMRYSRRAPPYTIIYAQSDNTGLTWSEPDRLSLPNPDASVLAHPISKQEFIMIYNHSTDERNDLSLAYSNDQGVQFRKIHEFEREDDYIEHEYRFGYPALLKTQDGIIHLLYTHNRTRIKHIRFNRAWLEQQL